MTMTSSIRPHSVFSHYKVSDFFLSIKEKGKKSIYITISSMLRSASSPTTQTMSPCWN